MAADGLKNYLIAFGFKHGLGPWKCYFCDEIVHLDKSLGKRNLAIHHVDHDDTNHDPNNLVPSHNDCHGRHHRQVKSNWPNRSTEERSRASKEYWANVSLEERRRRMEPARRAAARKRGRK